MNNKPFASRYQNNWIVKIDNLFEIRRNSRYGFTWGWAETISQAKAFIEEREAEILARK